MRRFRNYPEEVAKRVRVRLRGGDVLGRFSGNKLAIIVKNCSPDDLNIAAERFQQIQCMLRRQCALREQIAQSDAAFDTIAFAGKAASHRFEQPQFILRLRL